MDSISGQEHIPGLISSPGEGNQLMVLLFVSLSYPLSLLLSLKEINGKILSDEDLMYIYYIFMYYIYIILAYSLYL